MATTGRPSSYTTAIGAAICERIASGQSIISICALEGMPTYHTVMYWRRQHPEFLQAIDQARLDQADTLAERILEISEEQPRIDEMDKVDAGMVAHNRLRMDALKWRASKLKPKVYGDKQTVEHEGTLTLADLVTGTAQKPPA